MRLPPGAWSSQRHWHSAEDEFVFIVDGEVVLVTDAGEELLAVGPIVRGSKRASRTVIICRIVPTGMRFYLRWDPPNRGGRGRVLGHRHAFPKERTRGIRIGTDAVPEETRLGYRRT